MIALKLYLEKTASLYGNDMRFSLERGGSVENASELLAVDEVDCDVCALNK